MEQTENNSEKLFRQKTSLSEAEIVDKVKGIVYGKSE